MAGQPNSSITVAVIGLGAQGLVTVKNMLEEGYSVTGFERSDYIGGIWHHTAENKVETLPSTVINVSRERACFTDFPFPPATNSFVTASQVDSYLNNYADHFKLIPHLRLSTVIYSVKRNDLADKWDLVVGSAKTGSDANSNPPTEKLTFDKVIVAVGPHSTPKMPDLSNKSRFQGEILHSIAFKDPSKFDGKRVMVVGVGNTAADTATSLVSHASKVYLAHRNGAAILPRVLKDGTCIDHGANYRLFGIKDLLDVYAPKVGKLFIDYWIDSILKSQWGGYDADWNMTPVPSLIHQVPTISDTLIPCLRNDSIESVAAPKSVDGAESVRLEDGNVVKVDAIIYCTGYDPNFAFLQEYDPTGSFYSARGNERLRNVLSDINFQATPTLYQNIFSLDAPESLAFIGLALISFPAFLTADLSSMAIAQLWSKKQGSPTLPLLRPMREWWKDHVNWSKSVRRLSPSERFPHFHVQNGPWLAWVQKTIGTNVDHHLSTLSLNAWKFWWADRSFSSTLVHGVYSPHVYRLFDSNGRRKRWSGARAAIEVVNEDVRRLKAKSAATTKAESMSSIIAKKMPVDAVVAA